MQSTLIIGGTNKKRIEFIENKLDKLGISVVDQISLVGENSVGISQVRELIRFLHKKPIRANMRAGILPEAEKATIEAQNALLKILEEPPGQARIFLSAPGKRHLLETITSRCRIIRIGYYIKLEKQTKEKIKRVFDTLYSLPENRVGERFKLAEELSGSREKTDIFLQNALIYLREEYLTASKSSKFNTAQIVRKIQLARKIISANVNPRHALENLFLSI